MALRASAGGGGTPGGSDTQVQFNDGGAFGGDAGLTYNKTTDALTAGQVVVSDSAAGTPGFKFSGGAAGFRFLAANNAARMYVVTSGGDRWALDSNGAVFGTGGLIRWVTGTDPTALTYDTGLSRAAANIIDVNNGTAGGGGAFRFNEMTAPSAPATDKAVLFAQDNGAGKTQLCVRFATGAIQVLATEP